MVYEMALPMLKFEAFKKWREPNISTYTNLSTQNVVLYCACNYIELDEKRLHKNLNISARKSFQIGFSNVFDQAQNPRCCDSSFDASRRIWILGEHEPAICTLIPMPREVILQDEIDWLRFVHSIQYYDPISAFLLDPMPIKLSRAKSI
jgi:hypothetical protein